MALRLKQLTESPSMADVEFGTIPSNTGKRSARPCLAGAALVGVALFASGCSMIDQFNPMGLFGGEKYKMEIVPDTPASKTYDEGLQKLANGAPTEAAKKFTDLGKQYPSSDWARKGLLMSTYADYQAGDYTSTETSADRYLKEYPNSPDAAYVQYLQANAYYMQIPDISRDQEKSQKALEAFQSVVQKYPKSEYVEDAQFKIHVTQDQLAGKEMSIGRFYLNRRNYTAAINRFRNVLQYYQTTRMAEEALYRLVEAYLGLGITDEAQTAAAVLGHNFPNSQWYQDAYDLLKGHGLSPHEYGESWISKIYHTVVPS
jgi:outer membrane protein assembly factor BamD